MLLHQFHHFLVFVLCPRSLARTRFLGATFGSTPKFRVASHTFSRLAHIGIGNTGRLAEVIGSIGRLVEEPINVGFRVKFFEFGRVEFVRDGCPVYVADLFWLDLGSGGDGGV